MHNKKIYTIKEFKNKLENREFNIPTIKLYKILYLIKKHYYYDGYPILFVRINKKFTKIKFSYNLFSDLENNDEKVFSLRIKKKRDILKNRINDDISYISNYSIKDVSEMAIDDNNLYDDGIFY